jgi:adenylate cyclase class 2
LEVEQKFPCQDLEQVARRVESLGGQFGPSQIQVDRYYAHPARDFAQTDEALRLRRVGEENFITYKGPKLDAETKTRREIELPILSGAAGDGAFAELLEALGFQPVAEVRKQRRVAHLTWQDRAVEVTLDEVDRLGTFVELETIATRDAELDQAREAIISLSKVLELSETQRQSYLELLLDSVPGSRSGRDKGH